MLCCSLLWCVICYGMLYRAVAWCVVLCGGGSVLWSHDVPCGVLCFLMWSGWWGWLKGVLVAWQVGLFGSFGYLLGV